jgi:hypothetical protein
MLVARNAVMPKGDMGVLLTSHGRTLRTRCNPSPILRRMSPLPRPGRIVRGTLALLGVLFLPLAIWFVLDAKHRYVWESVGLFVAAFICLYGAFWKDSFVAVLDDL